MTASTAIPVEVLKRCESQLKSLKSDLLNKARMSTEFLSQRERSGDEIDRTVAILEEETFLIGQERLRTQLFEIELALARIERGAFGVCEETYEPIEIERLLALPWTRFSIEGAELREAIAQRFSRF